jgi:formiminotetrahydrofolate cyclodeaminase
MYIEQTLQHYLDDLASAQPTPGGGSASALSGAMGAALASMVCRLTLGKSDYAEVQSEIENILEQTEQLRARFQQLLDEDIAAYGRLSACYKMPRETDEERAARTAAIQKQLVEAALVPLEMVQCAAQLTQYCVRIAEIGNVNVLSDIATAAALATAAAEGASSMVNINLQAMKNAELVNELGARLKNALQLVRKGSQQVLTAIAWRRV